MLCFLDVTGAGARFEDDVDGLPAVGSVMLCERLSSASFVFFFTPGKAPKGLSITKVSITIRILQYNLTHPRELLLVTQACPKCDLLLVCQP